MANPKAENTPENVAKWHAMIGEHITKSAVKGADRKIKPFKSGKKVGLVMGVCVHDHTTNLAFLMDDGSQVECWRCELAKVE